MRPFTLIPIPAEKEVIRIGAVKIPPIAPEPAAKTKAIMFILPGLIPIKRDASGSTETAVSALPRSVYLKKKKKPVAINAPVPITHKACVAMKTPRKEIEVTALNGAKLLGSHPQIIKAPILRHKEAAIVAIMIVVTSAFLSLSGLTTTRSITHPMTVVMIIAIRKAIRGGIPILIAVTASIPPNIINSPCVKLKIRVTLYTIIQPNPANR
jgi:hypothetical protein